MLGAQGEQVVGGVAHFGEGEAARSEHFGVARADAAVADRGDVIRADPAFAAAVANAFADEYQKITVQLKTEPAKKASSYFNEQTRQLRQDRLSEQPLLVSHRRVAISCIPLGIL